MLSTINTNRHNTLLDLTNKLSFSLFQIEFVDDTYSDWLRVDKHRIENEFYQEYGD